MGHNFTFCQTCETPLDCDFCDKLAELMEPGHMTLEELKAEAKRQGYKLIKDKKTRFERCLCGHNVHQWCSGPEGWMVYCKHCGLNSPWAAKNKTAVIEAWNEMIRARRMGEYRNVEIYLTEIRHREYQKHPAAPAGHTLPGLADAPDGLFRDTVKEAQP